ncbi:MAG TPA: aminotransferase class I/II-fold pyridoxal phosphate-dependent enzyme [Thermoanaerobaculia bacterium]|jgi:histidinol-phosphate aminotransferase|nr:aminotransferase class I/II-fold pyridoxal phosphate-dependent enzyme [Thermoanaerobaculia bacterium]
MNLSRRAFARVIGAGAAAAVLPPLVSVKPLFAATAPTNAPVRLSSNENPYGPSAAALDAMRDAFARVWRYPDESQNALIEAIAKSHAVSRDQVLLGDGSSEILKLAAVSFTGPSRKLVMAEPTFEAIGAYAKTAGAEVVSIPLDPSYGHDAAKMGGTAGAGLLYICNPNNPTGSITPRDTMRALISSAPPATAILVDEAYHHYASSSDYESVIPAIASRPNLIVARTFSKIFGMAGLRCGYAVSSRETIRTLAAQQAWDSINVMALAAALASVGDTRHVAEGHKRNGETKATVVASLKKLGYAIIPSETNFIMIDVRRDVRPLISRMRTRGVHVGRLFPAMPHHMRVTIGKPEQMEAFMRAFSEVVA